MSIELHGGTGWSTMAMLLLLDGLEFSAAVHVREPALHCLDSPYTPRQDGMGRSWFPTY